MGREIRRVPIGWDHPSDNKGFIPLLDGSFAEDARQWMDNCRAWDDGTHPAAAEEKAEFPFYWQWNSNPPDPEHYRPDWTALGLEPDGYAVYETVSEGTPVTPTFATKAELVEYLCAHGDYGDQRRSKGGWSRAAAERFVERGWAPSLIVERTQTGTVVREPRDG